MKTLIDGSNEEVGSAVTRHLMVQKILLVCRVLSSLLLLYVAMHILAACRFCRNPYPGESLS